VNKKERQNELETLGETISRLRKIRGISLEKLAYEMDISKGNLSDIEHGKKNPTYTTLKKIAEGLELPLSKLLIEIEGHK